MSGPSSRPSPVALLSIGIACFSLATAMYQGYVQTRNLEAVQRDIARREHIRGCKDVIEAYFEAKLRIGILRDRVADAPSGLPSADEQAAVAISRFGAIGTFLANVQGDEARARYTKLTQTLEATFQAVRTGGSQPGNLFQEADQLFKGMNEDCVGSARQATD
ncbi:hypothetical protein [Chthonobacter albigriseus]|uniref:hypothetical protein n=1 Tax=Chthonobacter albigriseus TaxID=1683161 RepID=UPI0015EF8032|nr:hypothetical protein [Chthonobacter albigriseus]